jgi:hypothetical protein
VSTENEPQSIFQDSLDPFFKEITRLEAVQAGLEAIETEYQQTFRGDLVLKTTPQSHLQNTLFDFFYTYNVVEFKSENDKFDEIEFAKTEVRSRLLLIQKIGATYANTLNVIVCAREPKKLLDYMRQRGYSVAINTERPWQIECKVGLVDVIIVVCYKLPLEKLYYSWLAFTPSDNAKWQQMPRLGYKKAIIGCYRC